jgi:hypothetical protein
MSAIPKTSAPPPAFPPTRDVAARLGLPKRSFLRIRHIGAANPQLKSQKLPFRLRAKPDGRLLARPCGGRFLNVISWIEISQGDREIGSRASFCCSCRATRCGDCAGVERRRQDRNLNFSPRTAPDHPISLSSLAVSQSRSLLATRHQDGGSPRRAVRWDRTTTHELLQFGCDWAAKCDESLAAALLAEAAGRRLVLLGAGCRTCDNRAGDCGSSCTCDCVSRPRGRREFIAKL